MKCGFSGFKTNSNVNYFIIMTKCTHCGVDLAEGAKFCSVCGAVVTPAADTPAETTTDTPTQTTAREAPAQTVPAPAQKSCGETPPAPGSRYEPITTKGFIGIMFLMLIPLVNLLLLLVWAFGGCRKVNKQNFAKAMLVWMLIGVGLLIIFGLMFWAFFPSGGLQSLQESLFQGMIEP